LDHQSNYVECLSIMCCKMFHIPVTSTLHNYFDFSPNKIIFKIIFKSVSKAEPLAEHLGTKSFFLY